jgi:hypothetical protein
VVFIISLIINIIALVLERLVGIGWDFHVDSVTYIESINNYKLTSILSLSDLSNNLHYYVVSLLGSIELVISYNIILASITNKIIYDNVIRKISLRSIKIALIIFLFNPYKIHLATTILKDTAIIYFLTIALFSKFSIIGIIMGGLYRNAFVFYLVFNQKLSKYFYILFPIIIIWYFYIVGFSFISFEEHIGSEMIFREFDKIPTFNQYGPFVGAFLRAILWPIAVLTGSFFIVSPTLEYFPLFLGSLFLLFALFKIKITPVKLFPFFLLFSFYAIITPGFTTYYRYIFPILSLIPYVHVFINKKIYFN